MTHCKARAVTLNVFAGDGILVSNLWEILIRFQSHISAKFFDFLDFLTRLIDLLPREITSDLSRHLLKSMHNHVNSDSKVFGLFVKVCSYKHTKHPLIYSTKIIRLKPKVLYIFIADF